eukprot:scaffold41027_cov38-Attheya_sp.AAC.2
MALLFRCVAWRTSLTAEWNSLVQLSCRFGPCGGRLCGRGLFFGAKILPGLLGFRGTVVYCGRCRYVPSRVGGKVWALLSKHCGPCVGPCRFCVDLRRSWYSSVLVARPKKRACLPRSKGK